MSLWQDVRFGLRMLVKDRWFTLAAATALALGIGVNAMVFTLVNAVLVRNLPFRDPTRIMAVNMRDGRDRQLPVSLPDFEDWQRASRTFSGLTAIYGSPFNVADEGQAPEQFVGTYISTNVFQLIGHQPILGRNFLPEDDRLGAAPVLLLADGLWKRRYGGDASVIGRQVKVNNLIATVIGVMPPDMQFPFNNDLWLPLSQLPPGIREQKRDVRNFAVMGRLADGVTVAQARTELLSIGAQLTKEYPTTNKDMKPDVMTYRDWAAGGPIKLLFLSLMGAVGFVLLIACANVANLLLARAAHRSREISVRVSLGATRWRIIRQLLVESVILAAISGVIGFGLSIVGIKWFDAALPPGKPYWMTFTLDPIVFAFLAAVTLGTGIVFGLAPALHVSKTNVNEVLKEGGRSGSVGIRARRWTSVLIVGELGLTLALLAGAGFMMHSFLVLYRMDVGVDTSRLLMMQLTLPDRKYHTADDRNRFLERVNERLGAVSAMQSATTASNAPLSGGAPRQLEQNGKTAVPGERLPIVTMLTIGPRYFDTVDLRLARGRAFTEADGPEGHETAIVNQRLAAMYFPREDPIGQHIRLTEEAASAPPTPWLTIIGVAPNVRQRLNLFQTQAQAQDTQPDPIVYLPVRGNPNSARGTTLLVRGSSDPARLTALVREEIRRLDPDMPVYGIRTVDDLLALQRWPFRVFGAMFAIFAMIALVLSAVGLYAVTAYSVTQRTQEIGVRMALGAQSRQVWWLIIRRGLVQLGVGLVIGLAGAVGVGKLLQSTLVQTSATDAVTLGSIVGVLTAVALAACFWPARRATRLDPVIALRYE
jgi:putative ABC transport system permease protein